MKKINLKDSSFIIFILIAIFYAVGNFVWWTINTPIYPQGIYSQRLMDVFLDKYFFVDAPLVIWITKLMFYSFGKTYFDLQIMFVNYMFFLIGLIFMYKLCFELKNKESGNIAMILFALVPAIYGLSRTFSNQIYHSTLIMIVNIYCLVKLDDFKNTKWSYIYGITVGVGLLIKDAFVVLFFSPWLYVVIKSLIEEVSHRKIINIFITILIGVLISCCHYFKLEIIEKMLYDPITETAPIFCFDSLRVLTIGLSEWIVSPLFFLIFLISLYWFIFKYKNKNKLIIILWFLIPWLIMMFMPHQRFRSYGVPFSPIIILVISVFLSSIRKLLIKKLIVYVLLFVGVLQYVDFSYGVLNISLFDSSINICSKYEIKYYDKNEFIGYDFEKIKSYLEVIRVLREEYKDYTIIKSGYYIDSNLLSMAAINNLEMIERFLFSRKVGDDSYDDDVIDMIQDKKNVFLDLDSEHRSLDTKILEISEKKYWFYSNKIKNTKETYIKENVEYLTNLYNKLNSDMYSLKTIYISPDEIYKIYKCKD